MMIDASMYLLTETNTQDQYGVHQPTLSSREVLCRVGSLTRAEFFAAGRNGLNPSMVFTMFAADYNGERIILYGSNQYAVYRTYLVPGTDYIELYVERKGGTNG